MSEIMFDYLSLGYRLTCSILHIASLPVLPAPLKLRHYGALQDYKCIIIIIITKALIKFLNETPGG